MPTIRESQIKQAFKTIESMNMASPMKSDVLANTRTYAVGNETRKTPYALL